MQLLELNYFIERVGGGANNRATLALAALHFAGG
jgi:hypothetical protein